MRHAHQPGDARVVRGEWMDIHPLPPGTVVWAHFSGEVVGPLPALFIAFLASRRSATNEGTESVEIETKSGQTRRRTEAYYPMWTDDDMGELATDFEYGPAAFVFVQDDTFEPPWLSLGSEGFWAQDRAQTAADRHAVKPETVKRPPA